MQSTIPSHGHGQVSAVSFDSSQDPHRVRETPDTELEELVMSAPEFTGLVEVWRNLFLIQFDS